MAKKFQIEIDINDDFQKVEENINGVIKSTMTLKQQYTELKTATQNATDTKGFVAYAKAAADVKQKIEDANDRINRFSSDTSRLDTAVSVVRGLGGAFSAIQGTMGLLSGENEKLDKAFKTVMTTMGILNGITEVANVLNRKSATGAILYATANKILTFSLREATAALVTVRGALISTGIGAAIVALGTIVAYWEDISNWIRRATGDLEDYTKKQEEAKKMSDENIEGLRETVASLDKIYRSQGLVGLSEPLGILGRAVLAAKKDVEDFKAVWDAPTVNDPFSIKRFNLGDEFETAIAKSKRSTEANKKWEEEFSRLNKIMIDKNKLLQDSEEKVKDITDRELTIRQQSRIDLLKDGMEKELAQYDLNNKERFTLMDLAEGNQTTSLRIRSMERQEIIDKYSDIEKKKYQDKLKVQEEMVAIHNSVILGLMDEGRNKELKQQELNWVTKEKMLRKNGEAEKDITELKNKEISDINKKYQEQADDISNQILMTSLLSAYTDEDEDNFNKFDNFNKTISAKLRSNVEAGNEFRRQQSKKRDEAEKNGLVDMTDFDEMQQIQLSEFTTKVQEETTDVIKKAHEERIASIGQYNITVIAKSTDSYGKQKDILEQNLRDTKEINGKKRKAIDDEMSDGVMSEQEYQFKIFELKQEEDNLEAQLYALKKQRQADLQTNAINTANNLISIAQSLSSVENNIAKEKAYKQKQILDDQLKAGKITKDQFTKLDEARLKEMDKANKKKFEQDKKISIAQTVISTFEGAQQAYTGALKIDPTTTTSTILAAIATAAGFARVAQIMSTTYESSGSAASSTTSASAPTIANPFANQKASDVITPQSLTPQQQMLRVYVVDSDIIKAINRVRIIDGQALIM